jgi:iron-sulfur cluster repair protein YtfE (RIC family)
MIKQTIGRLKTATKKITGTQYDMLDMLRSDHMKVESMLIQLRIARDADHRTRLLKTIRQDLEKHMRIEETLFYPACEKVQKIHDLVEHSYDEHQKAKNMLKDLQAMDPSNSRFSQMVTKLITEIEHHVINEEEKIFPAVRKHMEQREFNRLNREVIDAFASGPTRAKTRKAA